METPDESRDFFYEFEGKNCTIKDSVLFMRGIGVSGNSGSGIYISDVSGEDPSLLSLKGKLVGIFSASPNAISVTDYFQQKIFLGMKIATCSLLGFLGRPIFPISPNLVKIGTIIIGGASSYYIIRSIIDYLYYKGRYKGINIGNSYAPTITEERVNEIMKL